MHHSIVISLRHNGSESGFLGHSRPCIPLKKGLFLGKNTRYFIYDAELYNMLYFSANFDKIKPAKG